MKKQFFLPLILFVAIIAYSSCKQSKKEQATDALASHIDSISFSMLMANGSGKIQFRPVNRAMVYGNLYRIQLIPRSVMFVSLRQHSKMLPKEATNKK